MTDLHLVRLPVDLREFTAWALDRSYFAIPRGDGRGKPRDAEIGYALHAVLTGLFGGQAPRPFVVPSVGQRAHRRSATAGGSRQGMLDVLGYASAPVETLRTLAQLAADELQSMIDWGGARSRPMPVRWAERFTPSLRSPGLSGAANHETAHHAATAEPSGNDSQQG